MLKTMTVRAAVGAVLAGLSLSTHANGEPVRPINVPAGDLVAALEKLSRQAAVDLVFQPDQLKSFRTEGVSGTYTPQEAIRILLKGTPLELRTDASSGAMVIAPAPATSSPERPRAAAMDSGFSRSRIRLAAQSASSHGEVLVSEDEEASQSLKRIELEEVVVTGSHIRGARKSIAPLIVVDREQIDRSGYSTTQDLFRSLPQNFTGGNTGASEDGIFGNGASAGANNTSASGINLRGLGTSSTLVLLNGHRIAPSMFGSVVDVSLIPLSAIERIDILTSGSSAIYGSDAVGGVVNFVLKKEYSGSETRLRYGSVTEGGRTEMLASQMLGGRWDGGGVIASVQYQEAGALSAQDRTFASSVPGPTDLFPETETYALTMNAHHDFTDDLGWYADILTTKRDIDRASSTLTRVGRNTATSRIFNIATGVRYQINPAWTVELGGVYSRQISGFQRTLQAPPGVQTSRTDEGFTQSTADLIANGKLVELPAGALSAAIGASYRRETPSRRTVSIFGAEASLRQPRDVTSAFAEISVPLFAGENRVRAIHSLDLTAAVRYDEYSDFGSATNPSVGLRWAPAESFAFRGAYSRSFRAPQSLELGVGESQFIFTLPFANPAGGADVPGFILAGSKPLGPERSRNIDVGLEFHPSSMPGLSIQAGYYRIRYEDRIILPAIDATATLQPEIYGSLLTTFSTDAEALAYLQAAQAAGIEFFDDGNGATGVRYAFDGRQQNAAIVRQSGYDLHASYTRDLGAYTFTSSLNATYINEIETAFSAGAAAADLVDTFANPTTLRIRFDGSVSGRGWMLNGGLNYVDSYTNTAAVAHPPVSSWTTVDVTLRIDADALHAAPVLEGASVVLSAQNLFDRAPPFVDAAGAVPVQYDAANASPLGRFLSIELRKRW